MEMRMWWTMTVIGLGVGALLLAASAGYAEPRSLQGPMPSMTHMMTGTPGPQPSMTPMMTMTPGPGPTPGDGDNVAPEGTILINDGAEVTSDPVVNLTLSATDNAGGTGVAWMYVREWGWNHDQGWHGMHQGGQHGGHHGGHGPMMGSWEEYAGEATVELSSEPGMKYVTVWYADAAWNMSPPATALINLVTDDTSISQGGVHQYRHRLHAGQMMTVTVHSQAGDPDMYAWMPGNAGQPDWWSHTPAGDDQVAFTAPMDGMYLFEVHGYSDARYDLMMSAPEGVGLTLSSQDKELPSSPLVADTPDTADGPRPRFQVQLPLLVLHP